MKIFKRNINLGRKVPVIDTPDLRDKCVTTGKLADGSVTTNKIADGAITREKIADKAITNLDNVVQEAQDTADHPTLVGEDNYVYFWNKQTHSYNKTSIYVRGEGFHVSKTFDSVADMEAYTGTDLKEGDFVLIQSTPDDPDNAKLYTFSGTQGVYNYLVKMSGAIGFTGQTPQFSIGSIITIEPTEQASASLSPDGTDSDGNPKYKLNLALPKGEKGTSDFVIVDDHSGAGDDPNKIYIPSANAEKENATAIANEVTRATEAEQTNATAIAAEEARARTAEQANATAIADEVTRAKAAEQVNVTAIGGIEEKIPTQATAQNKLADKNFVNSSISTATADFKGTYNSLADLQAVVGANANDYGFVVTTDAAGNTVYKKYKYVTGTGWAFEYVLNNSSFTAVQWATIQSGMTAALTSKLADLPTNTALQDALTTIRESVAAEGTRARAAEKANATAITNEVTRATEAEQTNATAIAAEEARARAAELDNATAIAAEEARARAAEADRYTKSETYTKTEVNDLVDTPHQEYVTVDAYSNLPATGSKDTIYRVSNYNGSTSQVDITSYSEYAWNGSSYTFLCVKSQIGEVFDISVYNNNTKYADLAAALNGGANIPQSLQKGGMSVKFVQSSDNKYVQYRLMADTFSTTPSNWQGVDDEPTAGSENLVKSGGVVESIKNIRDIIYTDSPNILNPDECTENATVAWVSGQGYDINQLMTQSGLCISEIIDVTAGEKYIITSAYNTSIYYYNQNSGITSANSLPKNVVFTIPDGVTKMRYVFPINANPTWRSNVMLIKGETLPQSFVPFGRQYKVVTNEMNEDNVKTEELFVINVLNPNGCSLQKQPEGVGGSIENEVSASGYVCSNLIAVKPGETYIFNNQGHLSNVWFADKNKTVIQEVTLSKNTPFVIPDYVYFMRYVFTYSSLSDNIWKGYVMLIKGATLPSRYIPYNQDFISDGIKINDKSTKGVGSKKARIILNFDAIESDTNFFASRKAILDEYGFKAVACLSNGLFNNNYSEWKNDDLRQEFYELSKEGFDFGLYTSVRADARTAEEWATAIQTIVGNLEKANVNNLVGYHCTGNNLTEGLYNALLANNFHVVRCALGEYSAGDSEFYMKGESDDSLITMVTATPNNSKTATSILTLIDRAITYKACLPIMFHLIRDVGTDVEIENYNTYLSVFTDILDYLKQKEESGELEVITWRQMYNQLNPSVGYENDYNRLLKNSLF